MVILIDECQTSFIVNKIGGSLWVILTSELYELLVVHGGVGLR